MRTIKLLQAWCALSLIVLCVPGTGLGIMRHRTNFRRARSPQKVDQLKGQSATLLPDGNWLLLGGLGPDGQPVAEGFIRNGQSGAIVQLAAHLQFARAWHAATILPNGQVLVHGGTGSQGQVVASVEVFDPVKQTFSLIQGTGLIPRSHHTATVLTNGMVLLAGGVGSDGAPALELEEWSFQSGVAQVVPALLKHAREDHTAYLLADGTVLLWGGSNSSEGALKYGEVFDPAADTTRTETTPPPNSTNAESPLMEISIPGSGDEQVSVNVFVAIRFSKPLAVSSINVQTLQLTGPQGQVSATVIPAEQGMLGFLIPSEPLESGMNYQVTLNGMTDANGSALPVQEFFFETVGGNNGAGTAAPVEPITIGTGTIGTSGRGGVPTPPAIPPLEAAPGVTAVSGRVLQLNGIPLSGVLLQVDNQKTYSDATGRFLIKDVTSGHRVLIMDGEPAGGRGVFYGTYQVGVDIVAGQTTVLRYMIWMTELDKANEVRIPSPTVGETVVRTPAEPGLELHLPANTVIKDLGGNIVTQLGITMIPVNQPPFPLPMGVHVPIYFTIQPGGAYLENTTSDMPWPNGAQLYYPNLNHAKPGTQFDFWNYDPTAKGWYRYGAGKVGEDGKQIVPDPGVEIYEFTGAMVASPSFGPRIGPKPGNVPDGTGGEPVDLQTGLFVYERTDLTVSDVLPLTVSRTYRQADNEIRSFGVGASDPYDIFLTSNTACNGFEQPGCYSDIELFLPDGGQVQYTRISPGDSWTDAVLQAQNAPDQFFGSLISWNGNGWNLRLKDGTTFQFPDSASATNAWQAGLTAIIDRYQNRITISRSSSTGALTGISSPDNRWIAFTTNSVGCVTQAVDNIGRTVSYQYDGNYNLIRFTDVNGGVTNYTYGAVGMESIADVRGLTYLANRFDANGRVILQTQADGSTMSFNYITDENGNVVETDLTDPLGRTTKTTFNANGYTQTSTAAAGLPEQAITTYNWDPTSNLLDNVVDPAGFMTSYSYDVTGNTTSVTQMAGTASAATTTYTYEPVFNQVVSVTDPLQHTTTYVYDNLGNLTSVTSPMGRTLTATYNAAGQIATLIDPLQNTATRFSYDSADLVAVTNALGGTRTFFDDGVGRTVVTTSEIGQVTRYTYNALNQMTSKTDAAGGTSLYAYDGNGNLTSLTDPIGHIVNFTYDNMDRLITRTDPLGSVENFQYDAASNLIAHTDRRGKKTVYTYDGLNRQVFIGYGMQSGPAYESTVSLTYDHAGRVVQAIDSQTGTLTRQFDDVAGTVTETSPNGSVLSTVDEIGRRIQMTPTGQSPVNYSYNSDDDLTGVGQGSASMSFGFDTDGRLQSVTLANGITVSYGYDSASQLTSINYSLGGNTLGNLTYGYDVAGRRTTSGGSFTALTLPNQVSPAGHNQNNQLTSWGTASLFYDANGNMTSDGLHSYTWNARNQLTQIDLGSSATFTYDPLGRRISKAVVGTTTAFLYDGANAIQESVGGVNTANSVTIGVDGVLQRTDSAGVRNFLVDGRGSTIALTDSSGTIQTSYLFDPFGNVSVGGATNSNSFIFAGREFDSANLYFFRARYYNPLIGRFISEDPVRTGTISYEYAGNHPMDSVDPSGLDWLEYTGQQLSLYGGNVGDRSNMLGPPCKATSGLSGHQSPSKTNVEAGPVPEGLYRINLKLNPHRIVKTFSPPGSNGLYDYTVPAYGVERFDTRQDDWGSWRARLEKVKVNSKRDTFYLHDSAKGFTHGCIETCGRLYGILVDYHNRGLAGIFVNVQYTGDSTNGGTGTNPQ
jgi:RHS repeat-associated protein